MALWRRVRTIAAWTLLSRVLGFVRDRLLAGAFGASQLLDSFLLAFALPNLLRNLFGEGALSAAFVPRYVQARERDDAQADAFAGLVLTRLAALLGVISGMGMIVAAIAARWAEPSWALVAALALPQLPYMIFICLAAIMAGTLNARQHFAIPAAAPVLLNVVLICLLLWRPEIELLPYGVLVAGVLQAVLHVLALVRSGGMPRPRWRSTPELVELRRALVPTLVASSIYQVNALLDSLIAYALVPDAGAVTVLYCANRLLQFPMALVAHGTGTAVYPDLAKAAGAGYGASGGVLRGALALLAGLLLPASLGLVLVSEELVRALYQTGAFGEEAVARTSFVTVIFAVALVPISMNKLLVRAFHAHLDQRTPMRLAIAGVVVNLVLNLLLVQTALREAGLALATTISACGLMVAYVLILRRRGSGPLWVWSGLLVPLLASLGMAVVVLLALRHPWLAHRHAALRLLVAVAAGAVVYVLILALVRWLRRRGSGSTSSEDDV